MSNLRSIGSGGICFRPRSTNASERLSVPTTQLEPADGRNVQPDDVAHPIPRRRAAKQGGVGIVAPDVAAAIALAKAAYWPARAVRMQILDDTGRVVHERLKANDRYCGV
jgi:hypothetical protein